MKLKSRNRVSPEFSMASITDVIFLLLTFFMLTASANQSALSVKLPNAKGQEMPAERVYVAVSIEGKYFLNKEEIAKEQIEPALKALFIKSNPSPTFVIAADEDALHKDVIYLMDIANRNKYKILIATNPHISDEESIRSEQ
ncbi:MAG: biopolymer transporter ExbD [Flavobacteriaceae bacterium]|jgi:biopolymer transport protein ExbD|nr:biopolymer transporter ExbD [Flavobacteriaceae bacterium]